MLHTAIKGNNKLYFVTIILLLLNFSCKQREQCFYFPNGEVICNKKIKDLKLNYRIKFVDYYGFIGKYNDTLLNEFLIRVDGENRLFYGNVSKEDIQNLENSRIVEFRFEKVINNNITIKELSNYLLKKYHDSILQCENNNLYYIVLNEEKVVKIEYNNTGIAGLFVTILPITSP